MGEFSKFIDEKRRSVATPNDMVDQNGKCVFGTFDKEFKTMELLKARKPTRAPEFLKRLKLTLWQATEVNLKNGVLISAVCDMAFFGKTLNLFFDKRTKQVYCWDSNLKSKETIIAPNLINGSITQAKTDVSHIQYVNNFQDGKCELQGHHNGKCLITPSNPNKVASKSIKENYSQATIEYNFSLSRISLPSVVSIPFPHSDNRVLYSQKDFFKATGSLIINGEEMLSDEDTVAIVDDHRGYYPRKAHYDWVTTMGKCDIDGSKKWFAFNLTRNQSIDQDKYNENLIWFDGKTSLLPPVTFQKSVECKDFRNYSEWTIKDDHDMVNLKFKIYGVNPMIIHALVISIDYYFTFGEIEGYVRDEDGKKYVLDGMLGIGEDKTLLL